MAEDFKIKAVIEGEVDEKQLKGEAQEAGDIVNKNLKVNKIKLEMDKSALEKELKNLISEMDKAKAKGDKDLYFYAKMEASSVINQLNQIDGQIDDIDKKMTGGGDGATSGLLGKLTKFFSGAVIIGAVSKLGKAIVNLGNNAQQAEISFSTMLGDANKAKALLQDLSNFAKKTPFELQGIRESATQLLAMGVTAEDMIPTLKALGDVSAGLNVPLERLALNYGQVLTQGKLTGKELKDFTTAGVPLLDELAKNLGKTKTEIQDMISNGQVSAQDMINAFKSMTEEGGKFSNLMEEQSKTLAGQWSNLQDTLAGIGETIGLKVLPAISEFVGKISDWIEGNIDDIKKAGEQIFDVIKTISDSALIVIGDIRDGANTLASKIADGANWIGEVVAGSMTESDRVTAEGLSGMSGNWSDFFYYVQQGITGIVKSLQAAYNVADKVISKVTSKTFWDGLWNSSNVSVQNVEKGSNVFQTVGNRFSEQKRQFSEGYKGMKEYIKEETKDVKDVWNDSIDDLYKSLEDNYVKKIDKFSSGTYTANETTKNKDNGGILGESLLGGKSSGGGGGSKSKAEDMVQSFQKELKELYSDMDSSVSEHQKKLDAAKNNIKKIEDQYDKLRDTAKKTREDAEKSIRSYNEQLEKNQADAITDLGQRYVELKKNLIGVDDYMKKTAENLSRKELQSYQDWGATKYQGYELKDLIELKEKLDELKLIEENTTEEQRKSEEFIKKTSKAQEILNNLNEKAAELEEKKAAAIEKQLIAEAMYSSKATENNFRIIAQNDEWRAWYKDVEGKRQEIHDADNIEYAKQLENQSANLKDQLEQYTQEKNEEVEILVDITARKEQLEVHYNQVFQEQIAKQKKSVDELIQSWERLIAKKNEYYGTSSSARAYGGDITNAKVSLVGENGPEQIIARTASYVQPRNASNTYSTVNNTTDNSFSINGMQINVNNVDEFLDELRQRMTYRN